MNRFDYEREVEKSPLPRGARDVLFALARRFNNDAGTILPRHMPSITDLERATALSRRSVFYSLAAAETAGWVQRIRPDVVQQRAGYTRTTYVLTIPGQRLVQSSRRNGRGQAGMLDRAAARAAALDAAEGLVQ